MKKIVVFGATGNIGVYFVDHCINELDPNEYSVIAVGRKKTELYKTFGVEYHQVDLCNEKDFEVLPKKDVYAVVNLAGLLPAYKKVFDPFDYIDTNVTGAVRVLEYARKVKADRVIYTQTWAEQAGYWGKEEVLSPDLPRKLVYTGDHAFYSITKSMVCDTMRYYKEEFGIKSFVFRLPNIYLYSPIKTYYVDGVEKPIAYRYLIDKAIKGEDIEMWGDPEAFKDIIYVKDLCSMMKGALLSDCGGGTYNAGTGIKTTLKEQIFGIIDVFSPENKRSNVIYKPEKPSFVSFVMDIEKAKKELNYSPKYKYTDYLKDYKVEMEKKRFDSLWDR